MSTIFTRRDDDSMCRAMILQLNALHDATVSVTTDGYHRDISGIPGGDFNFPTSTDLQVTASVASTLPTTLTLAKNIAGVLGVHLADDSAHLVADTFNTAIDGYSIDNTSAGTQLSSVIDMLNAAKLDFNAHLTQSGVHLKDDTQNTVLTSDASDLTSAEALANALSPALNAHILSGPTVGRVKLLGS